MKRISKRLLVTYVTLVALLMSTLTGCASTSSSAGPIRGGTLGGAALGAAAGSLLGGGTKTRTVSAIGGALVGGLLGNQLFDKAEADKADSQRVARDDYSRERRDADYRTRSDYERYDDTSAAARDEQERRLYEQWKRERGYY